jgi:cytochrome c nitrite reductase small subunit
MNSIQRFSRYLIPPENWRLTVTILLGILVGILILVFHVSNATSYLSEDPETCINCHVMYPYYASWSKDSHGKWATCSDCHVPQDNFIRKYSVKARDGMAHATYFTFRWEPQVITIKPRGRAVVQENCIRCHVDLVDMTTLVTVDRQAVERNDGKYCWGCHQETPHTTVRSLAAAPHALVERLPSVLPAWLEGIFRPVERSPRVQIPEQKNNE